MSSDYEAVRKERRQHNFEKQQKRPSVQRNYENDMSRSDYEAVRKERRQDNFEKQQKRPSVQRNYESDMSRSDYKVVRKERRQDNFEKQRKRPSAQSGTEVSDSEFSCDDDQSHATRRGCSRRRRGCFLSHSATHYTESEMRCKVLLTAQASHRKETDLSFIEERRQVEERFRKSVDDMLNNDH